TALKAAQSIRADKPQAKHDFGTMSDEELGAFFRGLHAGALATGKQLAKTYSFGRFQSLLDVGGGSGGLAIDACLTTIDQARKIWVPTSGCRLWRKPPWTGL